MRKYPMIFLFLLTTGLMSLLISGGLNANSENVGKQNENVFFSVAGKI